jgi:hypothetical protein
MAVVSTKDLLLSHDELRAAVILAGREIRKLNFGRRDKSGTANPQTRIARIQGSREGLPERNRNDGGESQSALEELKPSGKPLCPRVPMSRSSSW